MKWALAVGAELVHRWPSARLELDAPFHIFFKKKKEQEEQEGRRTRIA